MISIVAILAVSIGLFKYGKKFYLLIPFISLIIDLLLAYFQPTPINVNVKEAILLIVILVAYNRNIINLYIIIKIFLIFIIFLIFVSPTATGNTYKEWVSIFTNLMLFQLGIDYYYKYISVEILLKVSRWMLSFGILIFFIFQFTPFQPIQNYGYTDEVIMGSLTGFGVLFIPFNILFILVSVLNKKYKMVKYDIAIILIGISTLIIITNRTALLATVIGLTVYIILDGRMLKRFFKLILFLPIIFLLLYLNQDLLLASFEARQQKFESVQVIENEERYMEYFFLYQERVNSEISVLLTGENIFKSKDYFGSRYFYRPRPLHSDFNELFYGAGVIGLLIYLLVLFVIFVELLGIRKKFNDTYLNLSISFIIMIFLINISGGGLRFITTVGFAYLVIGSVIGSFKKKGENKT